MKLYDDKIAPNPRRVRVFLAEKGIQVPTEQVTIIKMEHKNPEILKKSRFALLPILELDDGTCITESVAICRYFEEIQPEPPLMGTDPEDKAKVEMWQRLIEFQVFVPLGHGFRHTAPQMAPLEDQVPEWGEKNKAKVTQRFDWLDSVLAGQRYVTGERYTIADITALCAVDFAKWSKIAVQPHQKHLQRWYEEVSSRPSAKA